MEGKNSSVSPEIDVVGCDQNFFKMIQKRIGYKLPESEFCFMTYFLLACVCTSIYAQVNAESEHHVLTESYSQKSLKVTSPVGKKKTSDR